MSQVGLKKIFVSALTDVKNTNVDGVGTLRFEGNSIYKFVQFSGTTAIAAGDPVYYVLTDKTLGTVDDAHTALPAGIAVSSIGTLGTQTALYGWIQLSGIGTLSNTPSGTLAVGSPLAGSTNNGTLAVATTFGSQVVGYSVDGTRTVQLDFAY